MRDYLTELIEACGQSVTKAALAAGINRTHLYRQMARHGVPVPRKRRGNWAMYGL